MVEANEVTGAGWVGSKGCPVVYLFWLPVEVREGWSSEKVAPLLDVLFEGDS